MEILLTIGIFLILAVLIFDRFFVKKDTQHNNTDLLLQEENAKLKAEIEQKSEKIGEITLLAENEKSQKDELSGKNKQLWAQNEKLQNELLSARDKLSEKEKTLSKFEEEKERKEKEFQQRSDQLEQARKKLEDEQERVRKEDDMRKKEEQENRDRIWNEHENLALCKLREVCQKSEIALSFFENTSLPDDFDTKLKPDFLVGFLGQYIIFDAKKSKDPVSYINDQVKKTAAKYKNNEKIYPTIFFLMPQNEIEQLKKLFFFEDGFSFYIISIDAIEPILANFKKIIGYENIKDFDPQDRETIANIIAEYDRHISFQNAANIWLAKESIPLMNGKESLPYDFQEEIKIRKQSLRPIKPKESEIKKISQSLDQQEKEIEKLTSPQAGISKKEMQEAQEQLSLQ